MSPELIRTIVSGVVRAFLTYIWMALIALWIDRHLQKRFDMYEKHFDKLEQKFDQGFDGMHQEFDEMHQKLDQEFKAVGAQFTQLRSELNDLNVAVARFQGPHQRLILPPR